MQRETTRLLQFVSLASNLETFIPLPCRQLSRSRVQIPVVDKIGDHRCGQGIMSLSFSKRAWVQIPVGSVS